MNKAHRSMKQNPHSNEAAKKFKVLRDKFGKSVKKLKKTFISKSLNHVLETHGKHKSYSMI